MLSKPTAPGEEKFGGLKITKEVKKIVGEIVEGKSAEHTRQLYFPTSVFDIREIYKTLDVDMKTIQISPREAPREVKNNCKLCMLVCFTTGAASGDASSQQIYVALDFCKTVEQLKYCFTNGNPAIEKVTKFEGTQWFELAKYALGLPCKLPRKISKLVRKASRKVSLGSKPEKSVRINS